MPRPDTRSLFDLSFDPGPDPGLDDLIAKIDDTPPPAAADDPWTSFAAALAVAGGAGSQRRRVLMLLWDCQERGATNTEIEAALGLQRPSGSNRRGELEKAGLCHPTGRTRPTGTGQPAIVYQITTLGQQVAEAIAAQEAQQP